MTAGDFDDLDILAGEYVIGTLDEDERSAFVARLPTDSAARRALAAWESRLAPLHSVVEAVPPPPGLWLRIETAIDAEPGRPLGMITANRDLHTDPVSLASLRRSRDRWRIGAASFGSLAAVLLIFVAIHDVARVWGGGPDPSFVAAVSRGGDRPAFVVRIDMRSRQVLIRAVAAKVPDGHSLELWYIGAGATPRSLGLITGGAAQHPVPDDVSGDDAATLAVSLEPPGGSPTGGPTGAVLYTGQLMRD